MMLIVVARFLLLLAICEAAMTMKQVKNTGKMFRKQCQPKSNAEDAKIDPLNDGIFIDEREVKCYVACIMKMANTMKNGRINYEVAIKQIDLYLPDELKEPSKEALTACRKAGDAQKDACDAAFLITKCIAEYNPSIFYFP